MTEFPRFAVASGEEASDPLVLHDGAIVRVDKLAARDHVARRGDQYDWDSALVEPIGRVTTVGLFDTERRPRPVAHAFAALAAERATPS